MEPEIRIIKVIYCATTAILYLAKACLGHLSNSMQDLFLQKIQFNCQNSIAQNTLCFCSWVGVLGWSYSLSLLFFLCSKRSQRRPPSKNIWTSYISRMRVLHICIADLPSTVQCSFVGFLTLIDLYGNLKNVK